MLNSGIEPAPGAVSSHLAKTRRDTIKKEGISNTTDIATLAWQTEGAWKNLSNSMRHERINVGLSHTS